MEELKRHIQVFSKDITPELANEKAAARKKHATTFSEDQHEFFLHCIHSALKREVDCLFLEYIQLRAKHGDEEAKLLLATKGQADEYFRIIGNAITK